MTPSSLPDHGLNLERLAEPRIKFCGAQLDLGPQFVETVDALQQLSAKLLLSRFRQAHRPGDGQFQRLCHLRMIA
jgi:hypothetical protein